MTLPEASWTHFNSLLRRVSLLDVSIIFGFSLGNFLSAIVFQSLGYYGTFFASLGTLLLVLLYVGCWLTESLDIESQDTESQDTETQDTETQDTETQDTESQDTGSQDTETAGRSEEGAHNLLTAARKMAMEVFFPLF